MEAEGWVWRGVQRRARKHTHMHAPSGQIDHAGPVYYLERSNLTSTWPQVCARARAYVCVNTFIPSQCTSAMIQFLAVAIVPEERTKRNIAASPQERWPLIFWAELRF